MGGDQGRTDQRTGHEPGGQDRDDGTAQLPGRRPGAGDGRGLRGGRRRDPHGHRRQDTFGVSRINDIGWKNSVLSPVTNVAP